MIRTEKEIKEIFEKTELKLYDIYKLGRSDMKEEVLKIVQR